MNKQAIWKLYRKKLLVWLLAAAAIGTALYYGIDKKIVVFVTLYLASLPSFLPDWAH